MGDNIGLKKAIRNAARELRHRGSEATLRYEHLDAINSFPGDRAETCRQLLVASAGEDVASLIHVARLLKVDGLNDAIAAAALQRPVPLEAKAAAVRALQEAGTEVPAPVVDALAQARRFAEAPDLDGLSKVLGMSEAWRAPALEAWLAVGGGSDLAVLRRVLDEGIVEPERLAVAVGQHGHAEAAPLLRDLCESEDRGVQKAAKRALHQLKARGIEVSSERPAGGFSMQIDADVEHDSLAYVTGVDGAGGRILWLLVPTAAAGYRLLEAVTDDRQGIRRAEVLQTTRRDFRSHMNRLRDNPNVVLVSLKPAMAAGILLRAVELNGASATEVPNAYDEFRGAEAAPLFAGAIEWDAQPPELPTSEDQRREMLRTAVELLGRPCFANWAFVEPAAETAAVAVRSAETSEVLVDDEQRKKQIDQAIAGVAEVFDDEVRDRYRSRLRQMSRALVAVGKVEDARMAAVAADAFVSARDLYSDHPFARALIQRGVLAAYQHLREQEPNVPAGAESSRSQSVQR